jgi:hypothetical protein
VKARYNFVVKGYAEKKKMSFENTVDMEIEKIDSDLELLICDSPTSIWDDIEKEQQDPLVMAAELAHRGHLRQLEKIKFFMETELNNLQQNPLLWQPNVRKIFNSMRISLNHMKAVVDATASRDLNIVSPVASNACYKFPTEKSNKKFNSSTILQPRPLH